LRRVLRRVKERENARKRDREENLSVEKKKEKSLFFRSQIVLLRRGGRGGSSSSPLFLRELDVFSFFFGRCCEQSDFHNSYWCLDFGRLWGRLLAGNIMEVVSVF
jgi:hypothetical protein